MVFKGTDYEREFCKYAESKGFHAERIAGSGAREKSVCDVVLIKDGKGYLVEVKSTKDKVFYLSDKPCVKEKARELVKVARSCKAVPLIAVRFKGKEKRWVIKKLNLATKKVSLKDKSFF
jgi:Holliday junction resolvase